MVVGRVRGGGDLVVGGGDGGVDTSGQPQDYKQQEAIEGRYIEGDGAMHGGLLPNQQQQSLEYGSGGALPAYGRQDSMKGKNVMPEKSEYR